MLLMLVPEMGMATGYNSVRPYMSLFFDETFGISAGATGTAVSIMQLAGGVGALLIPSMARRVGSIPTMAALRMLGGMMIIGAVGAAALPLVLFFFFVHYSVIDGTSATYISEAMERVPVVQRTTFSAVAAGTWSLFPHSQPRSAGTCRMPPADLAPPLAWLQSLSSSRHAGSFSFFPDCRD